MRIRQPNRGYAEGTMLDGDARAVVEADFSDIPANKPTAYSIQALKGWLQRLLPWLRRS